ncbi:MAG: hypothetical protein HLX50_09830 [Alteromonadaceae bacterium]|nr:hypothetical protein [Alteromonadaceae bacterium]
MSLTGVILGTVGQLMLAFILFMFSIFMGAGVANTAELQPWQLRVLDAAIYALPGVCVLTAAGVMAAYLAGASAQHYHWYWVSPGIAALYVVWVSALSGQG